MYPESIRNIINSYIIDPEKISNNRKTLLFDLQRFHTSSLYWDNEDWNLYDRINLKKALNNFKLPREYDIVVRDVNIFKYKKVCIRLPVKPRVIRDDMKEEIYYCMDKVNIRNYDLVNIDLANFNYCDCFQYLKKRKIDVKLIDNICNIKVICCCTNK
jgi:hypothetical protein